MWKSPSYSRWSNEANANNMKILILEGLDATGKTTFAATMAVKYGLSVQPSEGPSKHPGEIDERIQRYLLMDDVIFDRHPAVSQAIYGELRGDEIPSARWVKEVYLSHPLIIYFDPVIPFGAAHRPGTYDTGSHLTFITEHYDELLLSYRVWAARHAHVIFRVGANNAHVLACVENYLR